MNDYDAYETCIFAEPLHQIRTRPEPARRDLSLRTIQKWSGRETRALREAMRMSIRDFSSYLGVSERTVSKWESTKVHPRPEMQAALDTTLDKTSDEVRQRFNSAVGNANFGDHRESGKQSNPAKLLNEQLGGSVYSHLGGVTAVYTSRVEFLAHMPPDKLLDGAREVRAVGLSLNLLCQHYSDRSWLTLIENGAKVRCLFLDPDGSAVQAREAEEGFPTGQLSSLTRLNIETITRIGNQIPEELQHRIRIATYDETIRFNIILVDDLCITQPYLPNSRGVDSPTFVIERMAAGAGLYPLFEQVFNTQWDRGRQL